MSETVDPYGLPVSQKEVVVVVDTSTHKAKGSEAGGVQDPYETPDVMPSRHTTTTGDRIYGNRNRVLNMRSDPSSKSKLTRQGVKVVEEGSYVSPIEDIVGQGFPVVVAYPSQQLPEDDKRSRFRGQSRERGYDK